MFFRGISCFLEGYHYFLLPVRILDKGAQNFRPPIRLYPVLYIIPGEREEGLRFHHTQQQVIPGQLGDHGLLSDGVGEDCVPVAAGRNGLVDILGGRWRRGWSARAVLCVIVVAVRVCGMEE